MAPFHRSFYPSPAPSQTRNSSTGWNVAANGLLGAVVPDDLGELVGVQAGPADEGPVDVGLGHQFGHVARLDRTAVLDPDLRRDRPEERGEFRPDRAAHLLGVGR